MKVIKFLTSSALIFSLVGCASTNSYWKHSVPENPNALSTTEKKDLYNQFSIDEISVFKLYDDSITTKENDTKYSLRTFYPTMLQVSPDLKSELEAIDKNQQIRVWTSSTLLGLSLTPIYLSSLSTDFDQNTRFTLYGSALLGMIITLGVDYGFLFWQQNKYNEIIEIYNKDLTQYIFDSKFSHNHQENLKQASKHIYAQTPINLNWSF